MPAGPDSRPGGGATPSGAGCHAVGAALAVDNPASPARGWPPALVKSPAA